MIIPFTVTPANGAKRSDFRASSSYSRQLRFDAGETTDRINVSARDDTVNDDGETLTLCLGDLPDPYATLAGLDCATINIVDNDDPNSVQVSFSRDNYWASEDGNPAWPRIRVHPVPDREITIPITLTRGGGLSGADYRTVTTSVTFGPGLYGVHGDGHFSDNRSYASYPIEIWAIDDMEDDDGEYMDLAFGEMPPFVSVGGTGRFSYRPTTARVWFNDNEFTQVPVTDPPNPLGFSKRMRVTFADAELEAKEGQYSNGTTATVRVQLSRRRDMESQVIIPIYIRHVRRQGQAVRRAGTLYQRGNRRRIHPGRRPHPLRVLRLYPSRAAQRGTLLLERHRIHPEDLHQRPGRVRPEPDLPAQVRRHVLQDVRRESGNCDDHDKCKSLTRMSEVRRFSDSLTEGMGTARGAVGTDGRLAHGHARFALDTRYDPLRGQSRSMELRMPRQRAHHGRVTYVFPRGFSRRLARIKQESGLSWS